MHNKEQSTTFKPNDIIRHYKINSTTKKVFWLKLDSLIEIASIKTEINDYVSLIIVLWPNLFNNIEFHDIVIEYINKIKTSYKILFNNSIKDINNDRILVKMLASAYVKLALIENNDGLLQNLKVKSMDIASNISTQDLRDSYIDQIDFFIRQYFGSRTIIDSELKEAIITFKNDFIILKDIIVEELLKRKKYCIKGESNEKINKNNYNSFDSKIDKIRNEFQHSLDGQNEEIINLKKELEYYKNLEKDGFLLASEQRDTVIKDLFFKLNSSNNGNILDNLFSIAHGYSELSINDIKMILQNFFFVFKSLGITTYDKEKIGTELKISPEQLGTEYRINDNQNICSECLCKVTFPGWLMKGMKKEEDRFMPPLVQIV